MSKTPDILITGIPRSGTSYLCTQLHNLKDCVAINEPEDIFRILPEPAGIPTMRGYYDELRRRIVAGEPVANKISEGKLIEDTAVVFAEALYRPVVSSEHFVLATKNTLGYLARLPYLLEAMPDALFIACVRNPLDTLASWKSTFNHLSGATVRELRLGYVDDPHLSSEARARLQRIDQESRLEVRRALFWSHLAHILLDHRDRLFVLRYEDMVADPQGRLEQVYAALKDAPPFVPEQPFVPSSARSKRQVLNEQDYAAVLEHCGEVAACFGYDLAAGIGVR
jgi:hypothetical protein